MKSDFVTGYTKAPIQKLQTGNETIIGEFGPIVEKYIERVKMRSDSSTP